ncbi:MAG: hypothetical protein LBJ00_12940 [Planctomycetaceae bacterium]|nr:hypothetical protein [Planctomycetaceae bacterium]
MINQTGAIKVADTISQPVWAIGFALEQPLRDVTLACPALKQLDGTYLITLAL